MQHYRKLSEKEKKLLSVLIDKSELKVTQNQLNNIMVREMDDGKMGSLILYPDSSTDYNEKRVFGKQISDHSFEDSDGAKVIASLYIDKKGNLFELDIWKTDFSALISIPDNFTEMK
ncbi:DUF6984 family protein [Flavobacterium sp.]|uniref:DUF6984 family protein n=1 Tax=Flavobacterium sp. TaxID=239 RepID=UPI002B4B32DA|nr:hypothetical protein [Flavobacterium sp.]HLF52990.1 hypothetical protein [Flavobacterium sp.]